ncbi:MAG TPA: TonB-dependent receptor [Candidatus Solibacter sp.]
MRLLLSFLLIAGSLSAIQHSGSIRAADQFLPGATITARQGGAKLVTSTDEAGRYTLDLTPGIWELQVELFGFQTATTKIEVGLEPTTYDWTLEMPRTPAPAAAASKPQKGFQSMSVQTTTEATPSLAAAPPPPEVAADTDAFVVTGSTSDGLVAAAEEQTHREKQSKAAPAQTADMSLGGLAPRKSQKQAAQLNTFGNRRQNRPTYTGSLALTARNSAFDAKPFSLNGQNAPKSSYGQNTIAFNLGGPIRIPRIYSNDRLMFYFTYQATRARNPYNALSTMPSAAERSGDFSQAAGSPAIYDPLTLAPFPGNIIPANRISPVSAGLLQYFPLPTYSQLAVQNYQIVSASRASSNNYGFRQNLPLSRKDRVNVSFNCQNRTGNTPTLLGFRDSSNGSGFNSSLGYSHSFAPRFNSNLAWNFSRSTGYVLPYFAYSQNIAAALGIAGTTQDPIAYGPPNLGFTNFGGLSDGAASISRNQTSNINEGITLVRRKHNLTFGLGYTRLQQNPMNYANARGSFSFSGLLTSGFDSNGSPLKGTGYDFADFLLGFPQSSSLQFGAKSNYFRTWNINTFAQDDWRIRPGLSLNLGLRYEYFSPYTELYGRMANLDLNSTITAAAVVTPGQSGPYSGALPTSLIRPDTNNLSPRFGFAWKPIGKRALTIRGGYSIFYNGSAYGSFAARLASQPPFIHSASLSTSLANPLTLQNGFAAAPSQTITNNYAIDPNYRLGYAQTWTFAVQQNLPHNSIIELEYIGTKGTGLDILRQPNRATPGSPLTAEQRLQIGNATGFSFETSQGSSIMHMGQVRLTRRLTRGISAVATYGFQKSIDNASTFGGGGGAVAQNDQNLRLERGLSSFDQRHHLNIQYVLTSPVGGAKGMLRGKGVARKLLEDWTLNGGFNATSGTPITARVSGNLANTTGTAAFGTGRAQATGLPVSGGSFFNLLAFTTPPPGQYGNAGRNTIPGLFQTSLNTSFGRAFRLAESKRQLTIRLNSNNVLNHTVITNIGATVNSATYGLPIAASATRSLNLTVRLNF